MMVYLDVLLLSNLWVDFALLKTVAHMTHIPLTAKRCLLAAAMGALSALAIFLPPLPWWLCLCGRILLSLSLCAIAFGISNRSVWVQQTIWLFGLSLLVCGAVYALGQQLRLVGFCTQNTVLYADVSLLVLLFAVTAASAGASWMERVHARIAPQQYRFHLRIHGMDFAMPALADSGNGLREPFTGKPVVVCTESALGEWLQSHRDTLTACSGCNAFRLLTVKTVSGTALLPAFQPDAAYLETADTHKRSNLDIMVAITKEQTPAIVPTCCIRNAP